MKRITLLALLLCMVFTFVSCGGATNLSQDEQYALDCVKKAPDLTKEEIADNLEEIYIVKDSDQTIKFAVVKYYVGYKAVEAVFKNGDYYIDANETFDTNDISTSNGDKLIAQRNARFVDSGSQPEEWEVIYIDIEKIIQNYE